MNSQVEIDALLLKLRRIHRLSEKPANPGYAYRHLEHIHALCESLLSDLGDTETLEKAAARNKDTNTHSSRPAAFAVMSDTLSNCNADVYTAPPL